MKKTLTINLGGIVFNIDEDAFVELKNYLDTIKGYFDTSEGRDEIMTDIESRIAEMMQEKLNNGKQVINSKDISEIIGVMGQPEDYISEDLEEETRSYSNDGRTYTYSKRRLYRDTDESMIGGVASGIGYYFGIDPLWIRLIFVVAVFAGFSGILVYIILWIIMPEARTPSEKLAMKGEPVTFDNIGRTVEDEIKNVKKKLNNLDKNHVNRQRVHSGINRVAEFILSIFKFLFKAIGKILGVLFIFISSIVLFSLVFGTAAPFDNFVFDSLDSTVRYNFFEVSNLMFYSGTDFWLSFLGSILVVGVPFLALLWAGILLVFNVRSPRYLGIALAGAWILGIILASVGWLRVATEFSKDSPSTEIVYIENTGSDTLYFDILDQKDLMGRAKNQSPSSDIFRLKDGELTLDGIGVDILRTNGPTPELEIIKNSSGKSFKDAETRASKIDFNYNLDSNIIYLDPYFTIIAKDKWRDQEVDVNLYLPLGTTIYIPKTYKYLLDDVDNYTDTYDKRMVDLYWTMTDSGLVSPNLIKRPKREFNDADIIIEDLRIKANSDEDKIELIIEDGDEEHSVTISN